MSGEKDPAAKTAGEISKRITEYYSSDAIDLPREDPEEMLINVKDIIQTAKENRAKKI